ncbi:MAG: GNAT family N-acetyltransferase [Spirochaetales bacterium]|nr:GNAT family N-acetyltransferase [Spirochaetales bacterium]
MKLQIQALCKPGPVSIKDMEKLIEICNSHDKTGYSLDVDDAFKGPDDINTFLLYSRGVLLSCITLFTPSAKEAEVSAFTHPEHRRKGYFGNLLKAVVSEISRRGIPDLLFVCDRGSADGKAVAEGLGSKYDFSEYAMEYERNFVGEDTESVASRGLVIRPSLLLDHDELLNLSMITFNENREDAENYLKSVFESERRIQHVGILNDKIVGMVSVYREPGKSYIHGLSVLPEYRKRGIGRQLLKFKVREALCANPDWKIELEVQTENRGALSIYEDSGFSITACYEYFRKSVESL